MPEYLLAICDEHLNMVPPRLIFRELVPGITTELLELRLLKTSQPQAWSRALPFRGISVALRDNLFSSLNSAMKTM